MSDYLEGFLHILRNGDGYDQRAADEITRLRERLEQAERERDEAVLARDKWKQAWTDAGFRMGIEAAVKWLETVPQELQDRQIIVRNILALAEQKESEQ